MSGEPAEHDSDEQAAAHGERAEDPELLHGVAVSDSLGQVTLHPSREEYRELVERLRSEGYWVCVDLCGVDYLAYDAPRELPPGVRPERFEVVVGLLDPGARRRLRVRVQVPGEDPTVDSISRVHPAAEVHERETWDLFGIEFDGHPDPSRILMPDEWVGHPLRKDSPVGEIPVQFKATRGIRR